MKVSGPSNYEMIIKTQILVEKNPQLLYTRDYFGFQITPQIYVHVLKWDTQILININ